MITYYSVTLALLAFLSTTLDDFTVILIFFGREYVKTHDVYNPKTRAAFVSIISGQFLAFTIIVVIALGIGIGLRKAISDSYIDLIGFLPVMIGLYKIYEILDEDGYLEHCWNALCCKSPRKVEGDAGQESDALVPEGDRNDSILNSMDRDVLSQMVANAYGSQGIFEGKKNPAESIRDTPVDSSGGNTPAGETAGQSHTTDEGNSELKPSKVSSCRDTLLEEVALYGLLFGVDNISIYVSLICNMTDAEIVAVLVVFYSLLTFYLGVAVLIITRVSALHTTC